MHKTGIEKLNRLLIMNDILSNSKPPEASDLHFVRDGLESFGLPPANAMFSYIDEGNIAGLRKSFQKIFDSEIKAAADSTKISSDYKQGQYASDREFIGYINTIETCSIGKLIEDTFEHFRRISIDNPEYYQLLTAGSQGWYMGDNQLTGIHGGNNSLILNRMTVLKESVDKLQWLYENLADPLSRRSLNSIIKFWLTWDFKDWLNLSLYYCDVVDTSIFSFYDDEVFVDCGSYIGDTVLQFINTVNDKYKRIYTYDISSASIGTINENLKALQNIVVRHKGTGNENSTMNMVGVDHPHGGNHLSSAEGPSVESVEVVKLDDDIKEPITFLKIDVEGMDKETLIGAKGLIQQYHPKLNVDGYHKLSDIVDIPYLIHEIDPSYKLYLRMPMLLEYQPRFPFSTFMAI